MDANGKNVDSIGGGEYGGVLLIWKKQKEMAQLRAAKGPSSGLVWFLPAVFALTVVVPYFNGAAVLLSTCHGP